MVEQAIGFPKASPSRREVVRRKPHRSLFPHPSDPATGDLQGDDDQDLHLETTHGGVTGAPRVAAGVDQGSAAPPGEAVCSTPQVMVPVMWRGASPASAVVPPPVDPAHGGRSDILAGCGAGCGSRHDDGAPGHLTFPRQPKRSPVWAAYTWRALPRTARPVPAMYRHRVSRSWGLNVLVVWERAWSSEVSDPSPGPR